MKPQPPVRRLARSENLAIREIAGFRLVETVYPSGLKMAAHSHEPAFFSFVLRGAYTERSGKQTRTCVPSLLIFHPPDASHAVAFHNADVSIFRLEIRPQMLAQLREHSPRLMQATVDFRRGLAPSLAMRLYAEFQRMDKFSPLAIEGLALELVAEAARNAASVSETRRPRWLERVREILHEQSADTPTLSSLAEEAGVHPIYLARTFRKHYRCTVGEYVRHLRIETACREISVSDKSLSEIAAGTGFCDQSHFSNTFKRYTGMTPAEFRARVRAAG
ncbi:MAG TPA: helix-turn-helix transcriptional regulator [Pyrinomonadaceae bacterium]|nr:helix-turn-helix transcriptional regulator [Pyrinomonadaceae bacterium]